MKTTSDDRRGAGWVAAQVILFSMYLLVPSFRMPGLVLLRLAGAVILVIGVIVFGLGLTKLGRNLTPFPAPKPGGMLVITGIYAWVRHPIYSGLLFGVFGWSFWRADAARLGVAAALFVFFNAKARIEERRLAGIYPEYGEYARRVKRFIPGFY